MATVEKNFRIKNGLVVEGTTGTINGNNILTESSSDSYILNLVGGATLVKSVDTNTFTVDGAGNLTVNTGVFDEFGAASTAQSNAESYTDTALQSYTQTSNLDSTISGYGYAKTSDIKVAGNLFIDGNGFIEINEGALSSDVAGYITDGTTYTSNTGGTVDVNISALEQKLTNDGFASQTDITNAISTLGSQSSTDITNAITTAENYADSLASNYDAAGSAANAQTAAQGYADQVASSAQTNAENYADTAASNAQSAAESYADTAATNAENAAKSYTDTAVANLVDSAPSILDTLNKIDQAINNDANFSSTILSDIATAQATAESYTDSSISTEVTNRNNAIDAAKSDAISTSESYTDSQIAAGNATATPTYEALNVNAVSLIASSKVSVPTAGTATAYSWSATSYSTAKALVKFATATHTQVTEVLLTLDAANNIAITQFGEVGTNGELGTITANYAAGVVYITVTTNYASTDVMTYATLIQ